MANDGLEHIRVLVGSLGNKIAAPAHLAIDDKAAFRFRNCEGSKTRERHRGGALRPFLGLEVECVRRQGAIGRDAGLVLADSFASRVVIILDLRQALGRGVIRQGIEDDRNAWDVVEKGIQMVVEQRQPVLQAGIAPPLTDRLVKAIIAPRSAKGRHIGLPEPLDALRSELNLAHRHEIEGAQGADGALCLRVEGTNRFQGIPEEIEAHRVRKPRREEIDDTAANGIFACVADRTGAQKAVALEPVDQKGRIDNVSGRGRECLRRNPRSGRHPLDESVDGGREDARPILGSLGTGEPRQRRHALRGHCGIRRHPVVRLTIPGWKWQDLNLRREKTEAVGEILLPLAVASHMHQNCRPFHMP
jgi:hypothetical protein